MLSPRACAMDDIHKAESRKKFCYKEKKSLEPGYTLGVIDREVYVTIAG